MKVSPIGNRPDCVYPEARLLDEAAVALIPLFPLNSVLFPGMDLPLRIFEQRYRLMIGECLDRGTAFGVALIKDGGEVGDPATPVDVGTTARITTATHQPNGRINITTRGDRRFRIIELTQQKPYVMGRVQYLDEPDGEDIVAAAAGVRRDMSDYVRLLLGLRGGWVRDPRLPTNAVDLSYFVAHYLQMERSLKQSLLECHTTCERLEREAALVQAGVRRARAALHQEFAAKKRIN